jgi:hypothetical protein
MTEGDNETVALFQSEDEAETAGKVNPFGEAFGFEVYAWL